MKRLKKILKWTGIVLGGLVGIGLIANAVFVWITDTRLERQLAAIRAAGDPVTLADLARPPIPPEKNAATYLRRAQADMAAIEKETMNLQSISECPGFMLPAEDQRIIKNAFAAYPNVLPLLEQAAGCPDYSPDLDYTLPAGAFLSPESLDLATKSRSPARVLQYRAALLVAEGKRDEAVRTALLIFRLARHFDHNPMIVGYLVAIAVRGYAIRSANAALQTGPVSKEVRDALDAELAIQERMEGNTWAIKSELAFVHANMETMPVRHFWLVSRGLWNLQESACLEVFRTYVALTLDPLPYRDGCQVISRTYSEINQKTSPLAALLMPGAKAYFEAVTRTRAMVRALRVLNALQTHATTGSDDVPKLSALGLPVESTTDPYTGEPLHVKRTPQGWLVYSVGLNYQDDGGKLENPVNGDVGVGPPPPPAKPVGKK